MDDGKNRPDPDQQWKQWVAWIGEDPGGTTILEEVVAMMAARQTWEGFRIIYNNAPEEARATATFQSWIIQNYFGRQGLAVLRQTDMDRDVVSLARLIDQVGRYPTVLSRDRYASQTAAFQDRTEADAVARPTVRRQSAVRTRS